MTDCRLSKNERLLKRGEFEKVLSKGQKRRVDRSFILYVLPNGLGRKRLGIIASKKVGNAVVRNRAKRKIREAYRRLKRQIKPAVDIVVITGKDLCSLPNSIFEKKLIENLLKIRE
jgi:ribonuclease P protein component